MYHIILVEISCSTSLALFHRDQGCLLIFDHLSAHIFNPPAGIITSDMLYLAVQINEITISTTNASCDAYLRSLCASRLFFFCLIFSSAVPILRCVFTGTRNTILKGERNPFGLSSSAYLNDIYPISGSALLYPSSFNSAQSSLTVAVLCRSVVITERSEAMARLWVHITFTITIEKQYGTAVKRLHLI